MSVILIINNSGLENNLIKDTDVDLVSRRIEQVSICNKNSTGLNSKRSTVSLH